MKKFCLSLFLIITAASSWAAPNFTRQTDLVISSATPQVVDTSTSPMRLYFLRDNEIRSSTSTDGLAWYEESGVRLSTNTTPLINMSSITACSLLTLTGGGYRMLYSAQVTTATWRIFSATSADGLSWANDTSTRIAGANNTYLSDPRLVKLTNGDWRVYYLLDINGGNDASDRQVITNLSTDEGLTWGTGSLVVNEQTGSLGVFVRTDKRVRLYMTQALTGETTNSTLISALSSDSEGNSFDVESTTRLSTGSTTGFLSYPVIYRSTETFRCRILYAFTVAGSTTPTVFTGLTAAPDPQSIDPTSTNRTDPSTDITVTGEIFGSTPTITLHKSGQTDIVGTGTTWNSDQSITATFATNAQALGNWDVIVTNPDGTEGTLAGALNVTFRSGQVSMIDNLLRLKAGGTTQISVEIFEAGTITLKLYTMDGKLVNVLYDGDAPVGTSTFNWNGRTGENNIVASGTYVLKVEGPKLDSTQKIVVIR